MCLICGNKLSVKTEKDIVCCKFLMFSHTNRENGKDVYKTPYRGTEVELNALLEPEVKKDDLFGNVFNKFEIEGGAIHSYLKKEYGCFSEGMAFKAIVPKGSIVYFDDNMKAIASNQLFITDESFDGVDNNDDIQYLFDLASEKALEKNGVRIGDVYTSEHTFIHSNDIANNKENIKPIGVVSSFDAKTGQPIVVSLKETCARYSARYGEYGVDDLDNGITNTNKIVNRDDFDDSIFPAFYFCHNYETEGTKKGDWYLGAANEVKDMAINILFVNITISRLISAYGNSVGVQLDSGYYYWSSSEYSSYDARFVSTGDGDVDYYNKNDNYYVRAFLRV